MGSRESVEPGPTLNWRRGPPSEGSVALRGSGHSTLGEGCTGSPLATVAVRGCAPSSMPALLYHMGECNCVGKSKGAVHVKRRASPSECSIDLLSLESG